jgi:deazaflavin-dependent oxidoreductase (nitroreductase family)
MLLELQEDLGMQQLQIQHRWWHPFIKTLASKRPVVWIISRTLHQIDTLVIQLSHGEHSAATILSGLPIVTLITTGAKSSKHRSTPVIAIPTADNLVIVASNWGQKAHPSWYHNIRANPEVTVAYHGSKASYIAKEAAGSERELYWRLALKSYAGYEAYEQRAQGRTIPVIICTPKANCSAAGRGTVER